MRVSTPESPHPVPAHRSGTSSRDYGEGHAADVKRRYVRERAAQSWVSLARMSGWAAPTHQAMFSRGRLLRVSPPRRASWPRMNSGEHILGVAEPERVSCWMRPANAASSVKLMFWKASSWLSQTNRCKHLSPSFSRRLLTRAGLQRPHLQLSSNSGTTIERTDFTATCTYGKENKIPFL